MLLRVLVSQIKDCDYVKPKAAFECFIIFKIYYRETHNLNSYERKIKYTKIAP